MPQSKGSSLLVRLTISLLTISFFPLMPAIAQTSRVRVSKPEITKPQTDKVDVEVEAAEPEEMVDDEGNVVTKPVLPTPSAKPQTKPISPKPQAKSKPVKPINDGTSPSTQSDPDATDPKELTERADKEAEFESLKGDLPCLDSSSSCIKLLTEKAIANSPNLKALALQITQNETNVKAVAEAGKGNIFSSIAPFVPFLTVPATALGLGGVIGTVIGNLAGNSRSDTATAQSNANLQIQIALVEKTKIEVKERLEDSVIQSLIVFDSLKVESDISVAIANRESSRFKLIEVAYRLGEGDTNSFIALQNGLDRTRVTVTKNKSAMRSQAAKIRRIVLGDEN